MVQKCWFACTYLFGFYLWCIKHILLPLPLHFFLQLTFCSFQVYCSAETRGHAFQHCTQMYIVLHVHLSLTGLSVQTMCIWDTEYQRVGCIKIGPELCRTLECQCYDSETGSVWIQRPLWTGAWGEDHVCLLSVYHIDVQYLGWNTLPQLHRVMCR